MDTTPPPERFARWPWWRRWFGRRSERAAARFLRRLRYRILAVNIEDKFGEIDVLALDGETLVVIEVRSTERTDFEKVIASVDAAKQKKLTDAVTRYLKRRGLLGRINVRFDILAVSWPPGAKRPSFQHIPDAFPAVGRFQLFN
jgi:putative endonuclease